MKRFFKAFLLLCVCLFFCITKAFADVADFVPHKMTVQFENAFSTNHPPKEFNVTVNDNYNFPNIRPVEKGMIISLEVTKVSKEKIGKIDATVQAKITKVYIPSSDTTLIIDNPNAIVKFSKYEKLDITDKVTDAGISVANHFVKNLTYPAQFVKGAVQNSEGNRLKSATKEAYETSPLSYAEQGKALDLKAGDLATLTFYSKIRNNNTDNK